MALAGEERHRGNGGAAAAKRPPSGKARSALSAERTSGGGLGEPVGSPSITKADSGLARVIERIGALAASHVDPGDVVSGIIATEPRPGRRVYLCSIDGTDGLRSWLAVRSDGFAVTSRTELREAVSIAAICEVAEDAAGGGDLDALIDRLVELREREAPPGIEDAESAARDLRSVLGEPPQLATPARLDEIGIAARRLEHELDSVASSPFASALQSSQGAVAELEREIEAGYRLDLV